MSVELISVLIAVLAVGATLGGLILTGNRGRQIRRAQSRVSAAERKHRTRRLILMGSYLEHVTGNDPDKRDRLIKGLDVFLERDRDRELFDLPNKALTS